MQVSAIILAAGESTRMGSQKALLPWHGATLIEYHLQQLDGIDEVGEIIVVTGHEPARLTEIVEAHQLVRTAHNPEYRSGKVSSIETGVRAVSPESDAVMLLAVDQPRPASVLRELVGGHSSGESAITVPVQAGRRGHPVIFGRTIVPELLSMGEATQGIRAVMQRHGDETQEVPIDDLAVHLDLNRPEDIATSE